MVRIFAELFACAKIPGPRGILDTFESGSAMYDTIELNWRCWVKSVFVHFKSFFPPFQKGILKKFVIQFFIYFLNIFVTMGYNIFMYS